MNIEEYAELHYLLGKLKFILGDIQFQSENKKTKEKMHQLVCSIDNLIKEIPMVIEGKN